MNIALTLKLILVFLGSLYAASDSIDIDDYARGKYDLDFIIDRLDDIKAVVNNSQSAGFPYSDPEVQEAMKFVIKEVEMDRDDLHRAARRLGRGNMKYTEYFLHEEINLDCIVNGCGNKLKGINETIANSGPLSNPAMMEFMKISLEGITRDMNRFIELKKKKEEEAKGKSK